MWPFNRSRYQLITDEKKWAIRREKEHSFGFVSLFNFICPGYWLDIEGNMSLDDCWTSDKDEAEKWLKRLRAAE